MARIKEETIRLQIVSDARRRHVLKACVISKLPTIRRAGFICRRLEAIPGDLLIDSELIVKLDEEIRRKYRLNDFAYLNIIRVI